MKKKFKKIPKMFSGGMIDPNMIGNLVSLFKGLNNNQQTTPVIQTQGQEQEQNVLNTAGNFLGLTGGVMNMANSLVNKSLEVDTSPAIKEYQDKLAMLRQAQKGFAVNPNLLRYANKNGFNTYKNLLSTLSNTFNRNPTYQKDREEVLSQLEETNRLQNQGAVNFLYNSNRVGGNKNKYSNQNNTNSNTSNINPTYQEDEKEALSQLEETNRLQNQGVVDFLYNSNRIRDKKGLNPNQDTNPIEDEKKTDGTNTNNKGLYIDQFGVIYNPFVSDSIEKLKKLKAEKETGLTEGFKKWLGGWGKTGGEKIGRQGEGSGRTYGQEVDGEETDGQEVVEKKEKTPLDAEALQKLGIYGEAGINAANSAINALQANKAWREFSKLKTPRLTIPNTVRGATKVDTTEEEKNIAGKIAANRNMLAGSTGNLQSLMAGITNLNKQQSDATVSLKNAANQQFKQDENRMYQQLADITEKQNMSDYKYKLEENQKLRDMYSGAINMANKAHQAANQNLLGITKNLTDLEIQKKKDFDKLTLAEAALKDEAVDELKKTTKYYYKTDALGNILKDTAGNFIRTTPEEKREMESKAVENFTQGNKYAELKKLREELKRSGRIFNRNKVQKGKKIKTEQNVLETIINNFVNLTHKNTLLELQRNRQLYNASKDAVEDARRFQVFKSK